MSARRVRSRRLLALGAVLLLAATPLGLEAQTATPYVTRVEEDWSLVVGEPDGDTASPQLSTQMTSGSNPDLVCNGHINFQDFPTYKPGGLQMHAWQGKTLLYQLGTPVNWPLKTANETITWTQYLQRGLVPTFGVKKFASTTWGSFDHVFVPLSGVNLVLDKYSPDHSLKNSGISYGSNRVTSFKLLRVRYYYSDGTQKTDDTVRTVHPAP